MISTSIPFKDAIKLSFFDTDGKKVSGISIEQAKKVWENNNNTLFYFQTGDGTEQELTIQQVNQLPAKKNILPSKSDCSTGPVPCGPPVVRFFGGGGFGAAANAIISPISSSLIGFDIVNAGKGYKSPPNAELIDPCGKGSGSSVKVNIQPVSSTGTGSTTGTTGTGSPTGGTVGGQIKNITIISPGDGYLSTPDGSLGGNERLWKEPDEGYVKTADGRYYVVQPYRPIQARAGSTYYPPDGPPRELQQDEIINLPLVPAKQPNTNVVGSTYPVLLCIEEIKVLDSGFGYRPEDELIITPSNGTKTKLIVNQFGEITEVKILSGGCGFNDFPDIRTNSRTGFNATFTPIFKVTKIEEVKPDDPFVVPDNAQIIQVVDCVGKIAPKREFDIVPR